jgi:hypothetical protein
LKITAVGIITPVGDGERLRLPAAVSVIGGRPHSSSREPTCTMGGGTVASGFENSVVGERMVRSQSLDRASALSAS